jgi:hypothetical protein
MRMCLSWAVAVVAEITLLAAVVEAAAEVT